MDTTCSDRRGRQNFAHCWARGSVGRANLGIDVSALSCAGQMVLLTVSSHVESAAAVGPAEICVSDTLTTLGRVEKEAAIAHELALLERRDADWTLLADAVGCVLSVQPLVRMVVRRF